MTPVAAYVSEIIGRPWSPRHNCWRLVAEIQHRFFDRRIPMARYQRSAGARHDLLTNHPERENWALLPGPADGAVVLMSISLNPRVDQHAGVCLLLPHPIIVHVDEPQGVAAEDLPAIAVRGWYPEFYLPK